MAQRHERPNVSEPEQKESQSPLWRAIRLNEFSAPKEPPSEAVRQSLRNIWDRLRHRGDQEFFALQDVPELTSAPRSLLDRLVPTPDEVPNAADAVAQLLDAQFADDNRNGPCLVLVVPPHHNVQRVFRAWAAKREARLIDPPTEQDVLTRPAEWVETHKSPRSDFLVMPELERYYLRHYRGLELVRRWVEFLWQTGQRGAICCDSWAWAFLDHVCPTGLLQPHPFTPAPFEAADLEHWIRQQVRRTYGAPVTFRRADSGRKAVRLSENDDDQYSDEYLVHLAAYSRGNPMVAWSIWRGSLSIAASDSEHVEPSAQAEAAEDRGYTVWVRPWERITRPTFSGRVEREKLFLLHALLLHRGLDTVSIQTVLDWSKVEVGRHLQPLRSIGIVDLTGDCWEVTAAGYPAVRSLLHQEGFLIDSL